MSLIDRIRKAGCDNTFYGGNEGPYRMQQNPEELAQLVEKLQGRTFSALLEIGSACGGFARFLCEMFDIPYAHLIDREDSPELRENAAKIGQYRLFIGRSESDACRRDLENAGRKFDLCVIDGDHTYDGVKNDLDLAKRFLAPDATVIFHDICFEQVDGPRRVWNELDLEKLFEVRGQFGYGVARAK